MKSNGTVHEIKNKKNKLKKKEKKKGKVVIIFKSIKTVGTKIKVELHARDPTFLSSTLVYATHLYWCH